MREPTSESDRVPTGIPLFRPGFDKEVLKALAATFESGWLGAGPRVAEFEEKFAGWVGAEFAVAVTSGTAALHLACLAIDLKQGDEVLVPSLTFVSTAHAPGFCGATPVFVDVDEETCTLDVEDLRRKITPRSRAIIPVHYGGTPCRMDQIRQIAEDAGLSIIEDAAHACGAVYEQNRIGSCSHSRMSCFSFNALKNLSTGDGGMITTDSELDMQLLKRLRWMGIQKDTFERMAPSDTTGTTGPGRPETYRWFYEVTELGYKYLMNDVTATIGIAQLAKLPETHARREKMAAQYRKGLAEISWLRLPPEISYGRSAWHLFPIRTAWRNQLQDHLKSCHIATSVHYYPLHLQAYYRKPGGSGSLPVSEQLANELLSIPFHPNLRDGEVGEVIEAIRAFSQEG